MNRRRGRNLRIAGGVIVIFILSLGCLGWAIRQPNLGSIRTAKGLRADPHLLEAHVRFLAVTDPPRNWQSQPGLERAVSYIMKEFTKTRAIVSEQPYRARTIETRNLIAHFGPLSGPLVVVGAHYDVFGNLPGADDNASGVAGLLELARLLDTQPLKNPVELVAYSTEEPPFFGTPEMGSAVHAASLVSRGTEVRAMIGLEMIGYFSPSQSVTPFPISLIYPRQGDFVLIAGRWSERGLARRVKQCFRGASEIRVLSYSGPVSVGTDLSDHRNYWAAGYPAVMVTDTAFLRNFNYHTPGDLPSTLDYPRIAQVVDGLLNTVVTLAND